MKDVKDYWYRGKTHDDARAWLRDRAVDIGGWTLEEKSIGLFDSVIELDPPPKTIVELGVYQAKSLVALALGASFIPGCKVWGVDSWNQIDPIEDVEEGNALRDLWASEDMEHNYEFAKKWVGHSGTLEIVTLLRMTMLEASFKFTNIDILHIDGNHAQWPGVLDVATWVPKVRKGGLVWMDDVNWDTMKIAIELLETKCEHIKTVEYGKSALYRKVA